MKPLTQNDWYRLHAFWFRLCDEYANKDLYTDDDVAFWGTCNLNRGIAGDMSESFREIKKPKWGWFLR